MRQGSRPASLRDPCSPGSGRKQPGGHLTSAGVRQKSVQEFLNRSGPACASFHCHSAIRSELRCCLEINWKRILLNEIGFGKRAAERFKSGSITKKPSRVPDLGTSVQARLKPGGCTLNAWDSGRAWAKTYRAELAAPDAYILRPTVLLRLVEALIQRDSNPSS